MLQKCCPMLRRNVSDVPLLGETIGANLERTAARFADREALVEVATGTSLDLRRIRRGRSTSLALGMLARGIEKGRPGRHLGPELRRMGDHAVRDRQDRRDSGQRQPRLSNARTGLCRQTVRDAADGQRGQRSRPATTGRMLAEIGFTGRRLHRGVRVDRSGGGRDGIGPLMRDRPDTGGHADLRRSRSTSSTRRARPAFRKARRCRTTTSSTTDSSSGSSSTYTEARPGRVCPCLCIIASAW